MSKCKSNYPFDFTDIDPSLSDQLNDYFDSNSYNVATARFGPKGYLFPKQFESIGREMYNMDIKPSDIFVLTFPKSGTTLMQELVWLINNNFDYEYALETPLTLRFPFIETSMFIKPDKLKILLQNEIIRKAAENFLVTIEDLKHMPSPRFIKSHLPFSLLPPKLLDTCKVVYVAREPRDVVVSFYHHCKFMKLCPENRDFKSFWNFFKNDLIAWTSYFEHVKEAWQQRHHPNMLFMFYEDLSEDLAESTRRVAKHFNKEISEEQVQKLCEHLKIDNFKKNKSINRENLKQLGIFYEKENFIRQGKVGGWRSYFDEEMAEEAEHWIEENLRDTDLRFPQ